MTRNGYDLKRLVAVDNGSRDETRIYLQSLDLGGRIYNSDNMGCGVAWNQGALHLQAEWTVVMNNDIELTPNVLENILSTATARGIKVVSPGMIENDKDYDLDSFAAQASFKMKEVVRLKDRHAVFMAIHRSAFMEAGYFRATPKLLGFEDTLFFHEIDKANIPTALVGSGWIHHYGSVTVKALRQEKGLKGKEGLSSRNNKQLLNQSWLQRKLKQAETKRRRRENCEVELSQHGMSLLGHRVNGEFRWL